MVIVAGDRQIVMSVADHHRRKDQMLLSFEAPPDVLIYRAEVLMEIADELARAGEPAERVEELVRLIGTKPGDSDVCLCHRCGRIRPNDEAAKADAKADRAARRAAREKRRTFGGPTYRTADVFCT